MLTWEKIQTAGIEKSFGKEKNGTELFLMGSFIISSPLLSGKSKKPLLSLWNTMTHDRNITGSGATDSNSCGAFSLTYTGTGASVACNHMYSNGRTGPYLTHHLSSVIQVQWPSLILNLRFLP